MGLLLSLVTWTLVLAAAVPPARRWPTRSGELVAFGVFTFGGLVISFQLLGVIAAVTGRDAVGAPGACAVAAALCLAMWLSPVRTGRSPHDAEHPKQSLAYSTPRASQVWGALSLAACVAFFAVAVLSAVSAPPRGWDVLTYHLPRAVSWLQHGDLGAYGSTGAFYPGNAEIPLLSILFTGSDVLAPLIQLPFAALAGAAVYGIAREIGATSRSAAIAAAVFLFAPIVFFQTTLAKDDLVVTALVLAGALFLTKAVAPTHRSGTRRNVAAAGFALGLALGTKYSILPLVLASVPVALVALALEGYGGKRWATLAGSLGVLVVAILVPSAFWFIRNAVAAGNPIAPLSLSPGAWIGTAGLTQQFQFVPDLSSWWVYPWLDKHVNASYSGSAGFGAAFATLFLPGIVTSILVARSNGALRRVLVLAAMIVLGVLSWWFGKHHLPRFLLPVMGLACAPMALVFDAVSGRARVALLAVTVLAMTLSAAQTVRIVFREDSITWSHRGGVDRAEFYRMPALIYELPPGTRILLLSPTEQDYHQTFRYPLAGTLPGNDVVMEDDVGLSLGRQSAEQVHEDLRSAGIEYVFLRTVGLKPFTTWFDDNPAVYHRIHDEVEWSYPWYRESFAYTPSGEYLGPGTIITKIYAVLPAPEAPRAS